MDARLPNAFLNDVVSFFPPQVPPGPQGGRKPIDHSTVIKVIWFVMTVGCRWKDVPIEMGCSGETARTRPGQRTVSLLAAALPGSAGAEAWRLRSCEALLKVGPASLLRHSSPTPGSRTVWSRDTRVHPHAASAGTTLAADSEAGRAARSENQSDPR